MSIKNKKNILCLAAHPDDIELMAGGSIPKWIKQGHSVRALTFTDGLWRSPEGVVMRNAKEALSEEKKSADYLGYKGENLGFAAMELQFSDKLVCEALCRVKKYKIDTIVCPWEKDIHHDHEVVARIALSAGRRVPHILMGQINYYLREFFTPNIFVDITPYWQRKINALKCFKSEWKRQGKEWHEFIDASSLYYGKICGVGRAEGFVSRKFMF